MELWQPVFGFEGLYEVSSLGNIRSLPRVNPRNKRVMGGTFVKPLLGSRGYLVVNLTSGPIRKQVFLHKLILEAFVGKRPNDYDACHNNGIKNDCRLSNLRWDTRSANHKDKKKHGTWQVGEKANNVKLTEKIVLEIREKKLSVLQVVNIYKTSKSNAKRIINHKTWTYLDEQQD